ncbi:MAG: WecB/TagA/CpsF family glycosyltransferase [Verrucomicrobiota bacterium]
MPAEVPEVTGPGAKQTVISTECLQATAEGFIAHLQQSARTGSKLAIDFTNVHIVTMRHIDNGFRETTGVFDYFVPDSSILVHAIRLVGGSMKERLYGPGFMNQCVKACSDDFSHYFLGGNEDCLEKLEGSFRKEIPDLNLLGSHHGYLKDGDSEAIVEEINELGPDFVWVGMGTPRQQAWIHDHADKIRRGNILAVGFAFDVNAGTKKDAPPWMQKMSLTWLYRLCSEPGRLWWRYLKYNTLFLAFLAKQILTRRPLTKAWEKGETANA